MRFWERLRSQRLGLSPYLYTLRSPGIDSQPGRPARKPYLSYRLARPLRPAESIPRNRFLGTINVYIYGLSVQCRLEYTVILWLDSNMSNPSPSSQTIKYCPILFLFRLALFLVFIWFFPFFRFHLFVKDNMLERCIWEWFFNFLTWRRYKDDIRQSCESGRQTFSSISGPRYS